MLLCMTEVWGRFVRSFKVGSLAGPRFHGRPDPQSPATATARAATARAATARAATARHRPSALPLAEEPGKRASGAPKSACGNEQ